MYYIFVALIKLEDMIIEKFGHKIEFGFGSSSGPPGFKGMQTSDVVLWLKLDNYDWIRPYGRFSQMQLVPMFDICKNEYQLVCLVEMLGIKKY